MTQFAFDHEFKVDFIARTARSKKPGFHVYRRAVLALGPRVNRGVWWDQGTFDTLGGALEKFPTAAVTPRARQHHRARRSA